MSLHPSPPPEPPPPPTPPQQRPPTPPPSEPEGMGLFSRRWLLILLLVIAGFALVGQLVQAPPQLPYSRLEALIEEGAAREVRFRGRAFDVVLTKPRTLEIDGREVTSDRFSGRLPPLEARPDLLGTLEQKGVVIDAEEEASLWTPILWLLAPWLVLLGFLAWMRARASSMEGAGVDRMFQRYVKGHVRAYTKGERPDVTFADVAGCEQAKGEVSEIVDFLKDPERFTRIGARIPRGVLLDGPPGTGKTLLARAVAGEAGVPFYSISASEFIEMFVGVGAARVRSLFQEAKKNAPAIVFIDEIDSIGRTRGTGLGGGHDEREQTLNQILSEMDGFEQADALVVLAATNRPDVLDPALLRPGRFDRKVTLDLPDLPARQAILRVHVKKVKLDDAVDLPRVARATIGFSGADLKNLVNEAALEAVRARREVIEQRDFDRARERITFGTERPIAMLAEEKRRLAVHEAGHTLVGWFQPEGDPVDKVTIVPRGRALGATLQLPETERRNYTETYLRGRLATLLGGRTAEEELTGQVSTGAEDDIHRATELARRMVAGWGMDPEVGPIDLRQSEAHPFLGKEIAQPRRFSEETAHQVDQAVARLMREAQDTARNLLLDYAPTMDRLVAALEEKETLEREDLLAIFAEASPAPPLNGDGEDDATSARARTSRDEERRAQRPTGEATPRR